MKACPYTDQLVTVLQALEWQGEDGLRHLLSCGHCRERMALVRDTHAALAQTEPLEETAVAGVLAALRAEQSRQQQLRAMPARWGVLAEAMLAALTIPAVLLTSGARPEPVWLAVVAVLSFGGLLLSASRAGRSGGVVT
jgi:hypothetical protein